MEMEDVRTWGHEAPVGRPSAVEGLSACDLKAQRLYLYIREAGWEVLPEKSKI